MSVPIALFPQRQFVCWQIYPKLSEIVTDECKRVYSATSRINPNSRKALWVRHEERQVMLHKWTERLSGSSKGEWTHLLHDLEAWLERGHGQMNFYLTQVMPGHRAFNAYPFRMKLVESPKCINCDRRGQDDDACHTLFECPAFQLYQVNAVTTLQEMGEKPFTTDSLVPIMLKSAHVWDQVAAFVTLTMHHKMEIVQERQRWPIAAAIQHPMPDLAIPRVCH